MAQRQVRGMTDAQINQTVTAQLIEAGYTRPQATTLLSMANTMARGRNVGAPPSWMNGQDLDRVSKAIYEARNNRENARSTLEGLHVSGPNLTESQMRQRMQERLVERGYSAEQATQIMTLAVSLTRGRNVTIPPQIDENVVTSVRDVLQSAMRTPERASEILATASVRAPRPQITMRTVPAPIQDFRYAYDVVVDGRTYTLESNRDLRWSGMITNPGQTRGGRLMAYLDGAQDADVRITTTQTTRDAQGRRRSQTITVSREQMMQSMRPAYAAITREFQTARERGTDPDRDILDRIEMTKRERTPPG